MSVQTLPTAADLEAARLLLARLGVSAADLITSDHTARNPGVAALDAVGPVIPASTAPPAVPAVAVPTFAEYVPIVAAGATAGSRKAYGTYWNKIVEQWGTRRLDEVTASQVRALGEQLRARRRVRANDRGGGATVENFITALRCLYNQAVADNLIPETLNPARRVDKPHRPPSKRRAVPDQRLAEINQVAASTGNDPALDTLLLRLHLETACRRGGALALRPMDLDVEQCLVLLREKGENQRWQPVSPTLMSYLLAHAAERGAPRDGQLLRYRTGKSITARRYDHLWQRLGQHLPWVATQRISTHWLRHTTLTWVERNASYAVARAYAGHAPGGSEGTTSTYVRADVGEVAAALAALTGEPHPLAT